MPGDGQAPQPDAARARKLLGWIVLLIIGANIFLFVKFGLREKPGPPVQSNSVPRLTVTNHEKVGLEQTNVP